MILHETIKSLFHSAVQNVTAHIRDYSVHPEKDFSRNRKFPAVKLIRFLVAEGSSSTRVELLDFFGFDPEAPTSSAFRQQREKLKPEALKEVFDVFNRFILELSPPVSCAAPGYRCLAADGSTVSFYSTPKFSPEDYFVSEGHSMKGFHSLHVNALFDIDRHMYMDALLQPIHGKDEFRAFCTMVDRTPVPAGLRDIHIGDRGYCSYNKHGPCHGERAVLPVPFQGCPLQGDPQKSGSPDRRDFRRDGHYLDHAQAVKKNLHPTGKPSSLRGAGYFLRLRGIRFR